MYINKLPFDTTYATEYIFQYPYLCFVAIMRNPGLIWKNVLLAHVQKRWRGVLTNIPDIPDLGVLMSFIQELDKQIRMRPKKSLAKKINWSGANQKWPYKSLSIKGVIISIRSIIYCIHFIILDFHSILTLIFIEFF